MITVEVGTDPGQRHYKPKVELLDPTGNVLTSSSDGSRISHVVSDTGNYYIRVTRAMRTERSPADTAVLADQT